MQRRVLFVCYGNIHRSVIAMYCLRRILKKKRIQTIHVLSRGIKGSHGTTPPLYQNLTFYGEIWSASEPTLREIGIDVTKHIARPVSRKIIDTSDIVIAMDRRVLQDDPHSLWVQFPEARNKMILFSALAGKEDDVEDCGETVDKNIHRKTILFIENVLKEHYEKIIAMM